MMMAAGVLLFLFGAALMKLSFWIVDVPPNRWRVKASAFAVGCLAFFFIAEAMALILEGQHAACLLRGCIEVIKQ